MHRPLFVGALLFLARLKAMGQSYYNKLYYNQLEAKTNPHINTLYYV